MLTRGKRRQPPLPRGRRRRRPPLRVHPTLVHPLTPTDILEPDPRPRRGTQVRHHPDPGTGRPRLLLGEAAARYLDSLYVAAEHTVRSPRSSRPSTSRSTRSSPDSRDEAAWPTLRAHLLLLGAHGLDPVDRTARGRRRPGARPARPTPPPSSTGGWTPPGCATPAPGPLPWMPGHPGPPDRGPALGRLPRPARRPGRHPLRPGPPASRRGPRGRGSARVGVTTGCAPTRRRSPTSRSGAPPRRSPPRTDAPPAPPSCRRPPRPGNAASPAASSATTRPP